MDRVIEFALHTRGQMDERGATEDEVRQVLLHGEQAEARAPRLGRRMVFTDGYVWKEQLYPHKLVRVIYAEEPDKLAIVTVYVYYGRWEV